MPVTHAERDRVQRQRTPRITGVWPSHMLGPKNYDWIRTAMRLGGEGHRIEPIERGTIGWRMGPVRMELRAGRPTFFVVEPNTPEGSER